MFHRQRALLLMLKQTVASASETHLANWAFLVRHCTTAQDDETFYDFFPGKCGPYSYQLSHELDKLISRGYIYSGRHLSLTRQGADAADGTRESLRSAVAEVLDRFGHLSATELTDFVYAHWPWFTVNSRQAERRLRSRPKGTLRVYTLGYEGLGVDGFLNGLMRSGIAGLVDVRRHPQSRKYGYHKSTLHRLLDDVGIRYSHFGGLGIGTDWRRSTDTREKRRRLLDWYASECLPASEQDILQVSDLVLQSPTALLCMEADHTLCHRTPLAEVISERLDLPVKHLDLSA